MTVTDGAAAVLNFSIGVIDVEKWSQISDFSIVENLAIDKYLHADDVAKEITVCVWLKSNLPLCIGNI